MNQSETLNAIIKEGNIHVYNLLSARGKTIYFPKLGILSQAAEAKGKKLNATIGSATEDDGAPMKLTSIASKLNLESNLIFPYAPSFGRKDLRDKWKSMIYEKNPSLKSEISCPVVSCALTHGLNMIGYLFLDESDKIIMPDLYWENYELTFTHAYGAKIETFNTFKHGGFDIDAMKEKLSHGIGKKVVLLNFPNNPTGYTPTEKEAETIKDILLEAAENGNEIIVICDDAYFGLVFKEGIYKESIFAKLADLHPNILAIKLDGVTKEDYAWGFRVGFITYAYKGITKTVCEALESKTAGAVRGSISSAPNISQSLVVQAFNSPTYLEEKAEKFNILKERAETCERILAEHAEYKTEFEALPFNSGYFLCVRLKKAEGEKVRQRLLEKYSTGVIAFGDIIRIAFCSVRKEVIPEVFENLYKACKDN
jgi:aspartate/methionine/tyrosine aminotransferase